MGVPVAHGEGDFAGALVSGAQQFPGPVHPFAGDILGKGDPHLLAEDGGQVVGADVDFRATRLRERLSSVKWPSM